MTTPDTGGPQVLIPDLVSLDADLPADKEAVLTALADLQVAAGRATATDQLLADIHDREQKAATGLPGGIAIPHCRTGAVTQPSLGVARLATPTDFGAEDGPADLVFMILAPEGGGKEHMKILSTLARSLVNKEFVASLRAAGSREEIVELVSGVLAKKKAKKPAPAESEPAPASAAPKVTKLVGVTSCPTGIAHTYMAADALTGAADKRDDVQIVIETQGSSGTEKLTKAQIAEADAVIFAHGVAVRDIGRFAGKPVVDVPVQKGISEPDELIERAVEASTADNPHRVSGDDSAAAGADDDESTQGWGSRIQQAVMTGVSYMVPFVAAGGLLMAISFLIGGYDVASVWEDHVTDYSLWNLPDHIAYQTDAGDQLTDRSGLLLYLGMVFNGAGTLAMNFLVPALSGYTAYALADRPGIVPGFLGGAVSVAVGAGFLGGLVTGIIAGLVALWIQSFKVPRWLASMMPVVIIPLVASLITAGAMFLVLGRPLAAAMDGLQNWLTTMSDGAPWLLGIILGLMMCADLGGPINKSAYLFATAGLSTGDEASFKIMAAVIAAGMVPPLALALATAVRPKLWSKEERENGKASWLLGASFISEGAIPFMAADPLRIIPSMMVGGAVTGALSMEFGATSRAPHGGVWVMPLMDNWWGFLIAVIVGMIVSAVAVVIVKQTTSKTPAPEDATAGAGADAAAPEKAAV
jgi:PTS system fructose-specific IIC component